MRNVAKCKLCSDIVESFHSTDYCECTCGEISVYGGSSLECASKDWNNFVRIDEKGNEIKPKVVDKTKEIEEKDLKPINKQNRNDLKIWVQNMIETINSMPQHAMSQPMTHYDYKSLLFLIQSLFELESE